MPFSYHPPTRATCDVCKKYNGDLHPIIETYDGRASAADEFPFHNWYNFVLGYTPKFPNYIIEREGATKDSKVVDPFMGSGTTLICCKENKIPSAGVDANDFFTHAASIKLNWNLNTQTLNTIKQDVLSQISKEFLKYKWPQSHNQANLFEKEGRQDPIKFAKTKRPEHIPERYISDIPFAKLLLIKSVLDKQNWGNDGIRNLFYFAFTTISLPVSNVRYGPGFGVAKPRQDADVFNIYKSKVERMIADLEYAKNDHKESVPSETHLGDSRELSKIFTPNSVDLMITSPPYPGDHEYTKHSKLELIFSDFAKSLDEFRVIKKRMLRGSTTNTYKDDSEGSLVRDMKSLAKITKQIDRRLKNDGATSGFEKLYTKLVWEYFGGMHRVFEEAYKVLKPGGKFSLLVSDSHAFKMVHIETAKLLQETAERVGFVNGHIELWQYKNSTSHKYKLLENILTVEKPIK